MSLAILIKTVVLESAKELAPLIIKAAKERLKKHNVNLDAATEAALLAELAALEIALTGVVDAFNPPEKPLGRSEGLLDGMQVEVVGQDESVTFKANRSYVMKDGKLTEVDK